MPRDLTTRANCVTFCVHSDYGSGTVNGKASCAQLLAGILEKIKSLCEGAELTQDLADRNYSFPIFLNLGDGERVVINREIEQQIGAFAIALMDRRFPSYRSRFSDQDWRRLTKEALGAALSPDAIPEMDPDQTATNALSGIEKQLKTWVDGIQEREFVFGCHFSNIPNLKTFSIGPVRI